MSQPRTETVVFEGREYSIPGLRLDEIRAILAPYSHDSVPVAVLPPLDATGIQPGGFGKTEEGTFNPVKKGKRGK
jgi:hypothetical protein